MLNVKAIEADFAKATRMELGKAASTYGFSRPNFKIRPYMMPPPVLSLKLKIDEDSKKSCPPPTTPTYHHGTSIINLILQNWFVC